MAEKFVIGADFGTDSVRCVVVNSLNGKIAGESVSFYPRWKEGLYIDREKSIFRQHPLDFVESFIDATRLAVEQSKHREDIVAIAIDTTGSTPVIVDKNGVPLSLLKGMEDDVDGMFYLWKDHSSIVEASEINNLAHSGKYLDYTKFSGNTYSSEWFWAKALHAIKNNAKVRSLAYSIVEHCDWMSALLTGNTSPDTIKRGRCAAGHKCMWNESWGGFPSKEFFAELDPKLGEIRSHMSDQTYTLDQDIGFMSEEWLEKLNLKGNIKVSVGAIDAHMGAIGGGIEEGTMVKSIGTSTCDIVISKKGTRDCIDGICGEVNGSVLPGYIGYEAGQSAWGDYFSWFASLSQWVIENFGLQSVDKGMILKELDKEAGKIDVQESSPLALDWINGRRSPFANQYLKAAWIGLDFSSSYPKLYKMLLESVAFGAKEIIDCFEQGGVEIKKIMVVGGVARKSCTGMQILADITGREIEVSSVVQSGAYGAAISATVVAGIYATFEDAIEELKRPVEKVYKPNRKNEEIYSHLFQKYKGLGKYVESVSQVM